MTARLDPPEVVVFGEALVDFFPSQPGIPLEECVEFHRHLGGAPCNVAVVLARQGRRAALMTRVGADAFGRAVRRSLEHEGVDLRGLGTHPQAKTGVTFVSVAADGGRSFLFFRHPSADQVVSVEDVDPALIASAHIVHLGSSTLAREPSRAATLRVLEAATDAGRLVSCDPNWRQHLWEEPAAARPLIERLLAQSDVVKISDDELAPLLGIDDPLEGARRLLSLGAVLVCVTRGAQGALWATQTAQGEVPAPRVQVVDSTGAGDAFMGGLLSGLLQRGAVTRSAVERLAPDALVALVEEANRLGALAVTRLGATAGVPRGDIRATPQLP
jgi:fructokinase